MSDRVSVPEVSLSLAPREMLPFQRAAVTELLAEDGLLVGAPGLGLGAALVGGLCELRAALARAGAAA